MKAINRTDPRAEQFLKLVQQGIDSWREAGELLVAMVEDDDDIFTKLIAKSGNKLKLAQLETLERIGRKQLYPQLLLDDSPGARRVEHLALPYAQQVRVYEHPIPVVVKTNIGTTTVQKRLNELTKGEAEIVITDSGIRPPDEQVKAINEREASASNHALRYRIEGDRIWFYGRCMFTRPQLEEIIGRLSKPTALDIKCAIQKRQVGAAAAV